MVFMTISDITSELWVPRLKAQMDTTCLVCALAFLTPAPGFAQLSDAAYCNALADKYQRYVAVEDPGPGETKAPVAVMHAMEQCESGNVSSAIPVLEKALKAAKIDLPPRG